MQLILLQRWNKKPRRRNQTNNLQISEGEVKDGRERESCSTIELRQPLYGSHQPNQAVVADGILDQPATGVHPPESPYKSHLLY